jgi:hypothetical protein
MNDCTIGVVETRPVILHGQYTDYIVNEFGDVINTKTGCILVAYVHPVTGYASVGIHIDGKCYTTLVHRIVASAFIPNPYDLPHVNHIDGIKTHNWHKNLEWTTFQGNMDHAVATGLLDIKGIKHPENVYSEDQIRKVCEMLEARTFMPIEIERDTGVNRGIIHHIRAGKTWTHISKNYDIPPIAEQLNYAGKITVYSDAQKHMVCELLQNNSLSAVDISNMTGVHEAMVRQAAKGDIWKDIVSEYNIDPDRGTVMLHRRDYSDDQIRSVCKLLMDPNRSFLSIAEETGVGIDTVKDVGNREGTWIHISDEFDLPVARKHPRRYGPRNPRTKAVIQLISDGQSAEFIINELISKHGVKSKDLAKECIKRVENQWF